MSILCSATVAVSSSSWPIQSKVLTLGVAIWTVLLNLSKFCLCLSSVADFSKTGDKTPTSVRTHPVFTHMKGDVVWTHGLSESHDNLSMDVFLLQ